MPMNITDLAAAPDAEAILRELERLDLFRHAHELEACGVSVYSFRQRPVTPAVTPGLEAATMPGDFRERTGTHRNVATP